MKRIKIKSNFLRNVLILSSGTVAAQIVNLFLQPIITRLYGPESYGLMGSFTAIVMLLMPIVAFSYPSAIVLPKCNNEAKGLIKLSLLITISLAIISSITLIFFNNQLVLVFQLEEISSYLYLLPIVIIFSGILQVTQQWLVRTKEFSVIAKATFIQSLISNFSKIGIGLFFPTAPVLIIITALGNGIQTIIMNILNKFSFLKKEDNESISIKKLAKKYKDFPMYRTPTLFLDSMSNTLPVLMLASFFGPVSVGFYSIGRTVLQIPTRLIGRSVADVFYARISEAANNKEKLSQLIIKGTLGLGAVGIVPFGLVIAFGPFLFSFVFGTEWYTAGEYARWVSIGTIFSFMNKPSVRALPVMSMQAFQFRYSLIILFVRLAALTIGYYLFRSDLVSIALFGISGAILNIILILITIVKSKKFEKDNGYT